MRMRLLYAGLVLLLLAGAALAILRPSGKLYRGRPVSYWRQAAIMRDGCVVYEAPTTAWEDAFHKVGIYAFDLDAEADADKLFDGDPAGIPLMLELLQDENIQVCMRAALGLSRVGHAKIAAEVLLERLKTANEDRFLPLIAYEILVIDPQAAADGAVPILIRRMRDGSPYADFMLGQYGPRAKAAVPELLAVLEKCKAAKGDCVQIAVALLQIDPQATKAVALPIVLEEFRKREPRAYAIDEFLELESLAGETAKNVEGTDPEVAKTILKEMQRVKFQKLHLRSGSGK